MCHGKNAVTDCILISTSVLNLDNFVVCNVLSIIFCVRCIFCSQNKHIMIESLRGIGNTSFPVLVVISFSALTLLVGQQEGHRPVKT